MFDDIIMNITSNKKLAHPIEENDFFLHRLKTTSSMRTRVSTQDFYWKKGTYECLEVPCVHFETIFNPHIKKGHFKWWYEWKGRLFAGFLWKVPQEVYLYAFIIIK